MKPPCKPSIFRDWTGMWIAAVPCKSGIIGEYFASTHDRALWLGYRLMWEFWGNEWWK